jgi:hypothetical protein
MRSSAKLVLSTARGVRTMSAICFASSRCGHNTRSIDIPTRVIAPSRRKASR